MNVAAPPIPSRWKKLLRRGALAGGAILLVIFVGLMLLPIWMSNDQGRAYVLDRLNARLDGPRVTVDKWSIGWFSPTELTNLRIMEPDGTEVVSCPHVSSGLTLWDIWRGTYDIRNTTADQLELHITRRPDGLNSLDTLLAGAGEVLKATRGALQIRDGRLILTSLKTGVSQRYVDLRATITIASRYAPFHVQVSAVEESRGGPGTGTFSLNATFPPTTTLTADSLRYPQAWSLLSEMELTAVRVPAALACEFAGVDPAWAESFGDMFASIQITGHATTAQDGSRLVMALQGTGTSRPEIEARMLLRPINRDQRGELTISPGRDHEVRGAVRWSPPLARLLNQVNPILGEASAAPESPPGLVRVNILEMRVPLDDPAKSSGTARIVFPPLRFVARDGPSIVRQVQVITGEISSERPAPGAPGVEGSAGNLRFSLANGRLSYENFLVTLGRSRLDFSGSVGIDGTLDLTAVIPEATQAFTAGSSRVVVSGTPEAPLLKRPQ